MANDKFCSPIPTRLALLQRAEIRLRIYEIDYLVCVYCKNHHFRLPHPPGCPDLDVDPTIESRPSFANRVTKQSAYRMHVEIGVYFQVQVQVQVQVIRRSNIRNEGPLVNC